MLGLVVSLLFDSWRLDKCRMLTTSTCVAIVISEIQGFLADLMIMFLGELAIAGSTGNRMSYATPNRV